MPDRTPHPLKRRLADVGMVFFGMIMAVTPLALWVAPTAPWFYFFLEMFVFSSVAVWYLSSYETSAAEHQMKQRSPSGKATLSERAIIRLQNMCILERNTEAQKELRELTEKHRNDIRKSRISSE